MCLRRLYERATQALDPEVIELALAGARAPVESCCGRADRSAYAARRPGGPHAQPGAIPAAHPAHDLTFGIGPAGTGKTFLAVACAVDALERSTVQRIVLTRPAVEAGERLGFLPGDLAQKVDPYLRPLYDALYDLMGLERVTKAFERGALEIAPLAFMRGRTLNHAFVILDEAQNTTPEQMKMFLTRIGFGTKAVVTGDTSQIDLPRGATSGLLDARAGAARRAGHRLHALHLGRRGSAPAGGAHRRGLRRGSDANLERGRRMTRCRALRLSLQFADASHRALLPRHRVQRWMRASLRCTGRTHRARSWAERRAAHSIDSFAAATTRPTC